ncbi:hypothetical protein BDV39DRAFT_44572 [Aspergillus sergii]|uniref:Rad60/SUMO-like domain-containing protein n=1 Tax=Aspergillus sergii TaxID=1034303 RepID=A0A5N6WHS4_9EURO|nr:hypothetical protein BDV39DRAFT_44572 [Aspergillus sergii]
MRSFFKRPTWATTGDDELDSNDFYRRAGQTYTDIIAASKVPRDSPPCRSTTENGKVCKRRHISQEPSSRETASRALPGDGQEECDIQGVSPCSFDSCKTSPEISDRNDCRMPMQFLGPYPSTNAEITKTKMAVGKTPVSCDTRKNQRKAAIHTDQHSDSMKYDPVVQILITSKIENTKPLIVHRKMSQSLRDVRLAWCNCQSIPKEMQSFILLTWKGRRLFDVTTCRSLGINVPKGLADSPVYGDHVRHGSKEDIRIHMEAVIEDNVMAMDGWQASHESYLASAQESTATDSSRLLSTRVVLKCPRSGDLVFDGDRLDPCSCLSMYDMADGDLVDVVVK